MLFFAFDISNQLVNVSQLEHSGHLLCPFCHSKVRSLKVVGQSCYRFFHTDRYSICRPTIRKQLMLYFANLPQQFTLTLPGYTHRIEQYSLQYPDYPQKYFTFPEQVYEIPTITVTLTNEDFIRLDVGDDDFLAYQFNHESNSYILVFNLFEETQVLPDFFDERVYYSSTVFEITMPSKPTEVFRDGFDFDKIMNNLEGAYLRNELLQDTMKKPQLLLHESYVEWVRQQSQQLKKLETSGVIKMRQK